MTDNVNSPAHYNAGGQIECIDAIQAQLTPEEFRGYLKGNIAKYIWRERHKGGVESQRKARWYLDRLIPHRAPEAAEADRARADAHARVQRDVLRGATPSQSDLEAWLNPTTPNVT